jgi:hypothetical protein
VKKPPYIGNIAAIIVAAGLIIFTVWTGHTDVFTLVLVLIVVIGQALALIGYQQVRDQLEREYAAVQARLDSATAALARRGRR